MSSRAVVNRQSVDASASRSYTLQKVDLVEPSPPGAALGVLCGAKKGSA
ncbi:hypothetical protein [Streptomyces sp. NBC_00576]|nr:hypothetical protein [Streptomyces sp. NBC_00576]WUB69554.1 hypothetical protein OG734_05460 [Streptomyces sp. NBC_00576]